MFFRPVTLLCHKHSKKTAYYIRNFENLIFLAWNIIMMITPK